MNLKNKVAIITGGGGNIGRHTAFRLAAEGAKVAVCDIKLETAQKVADEITANNGEAIAIELDVQNSKEVDDAVNTVVTKFGKVDILVNSAGGSARSKSKDLCEQTNDIIKENIGVNLFGAIYFARAVSRNMIENRQGRIISVASILGLHGKRGHVEYSAAKGGLIAMTKSLAIELGQYNINVNCVSPGLVQRDDQDVSHTNYLGRNGTADEVASLIAFLLSDEASFITGQNYIIDGGRSLGLKGDY